MPTLEAQQHSKDEAEHLITLDADIDSDGVFGHQKFTVSETEIRVCETAGAVTFSMPIAEIVYAKDRFPSHLWSYDSNRPY